MNIFKKLFSKLKKKENEPETWYNTITNTYDPKVGTPNGEAYSSPNGVVMGISKHR